MGERDKPEVGDWQVAPRNGVLIQEPRKSKRDHSRSRSAAGKEQAARVDRQKAAAKLNESFYHNGADWHLPRRAS